MDKLLHRVRGKVERGERISTADCRGLFDLHNLNDFSKLARVVRERRYGRDALYRAAEVFEYRGEDPDLFFSEMDTVAAPDTPDLVLRLISKGGVSAEGWLERCRTFTKAPRHITAELDARFVAEIVEAGEKKAGEFLTALKSLMPVWISGNGAELFNDTWRAAFSPDAVSAERWLAVHQGAHELGMKTGASMLYHSGWNPDLYVAHLDMLRSLQDKTGGFVSFVPVGFHDSSPDARYLATPSGGTTLKMTAISRLFLDNIPHIVTAPGLGDPEISWAALSYGADTVDALIRPGDRIHTDVSAGNELFVLSDGGGKKRDGLTLGQIEDRIYEAQWNPIAVNSNFERLLIEEIS